MSTDLEQELRDYGAAPQHAPEFHSLLRAAIHEEKARRRAAEVAGAGIPSRARPARRRRLGRWALLAAALSALVVTVAIIGAHTAPELRQPPTASAAEVIALARHSMTRTETISATLVHTSTTIAYPSLGDLKGDWTSADFFALAHVRGPAVPYSDPVHLVVTGGGRSRLVAPVTQATYAASTRPDGSVVVVRTVPEQLRLTRSVPAEEVTTSDLRAGVRGVFRPGYSYVGGGDSGTVAERATITTGTAPGPPDSTDSTGGFTSWLDVCTQSILAAGTASATTYEGRPAVVVAADVTPGPVVRGTETDMVDGAKASFPTAAVYRELDRIEVTFDRDSWFPMRRTTFLHGEVVDDLRLTDVKVDKPVPAGQFAPAFPAGVKAGTSSEGFRRVSLTEAAHAFDYRPLAPDALPADLAFSCAAVASSSSFTAVKPDSAFGDVTRITSRDITALQYRAGFLAVTVTTRRDEGLRLPGLAYPFVADPSQAAAPDERSTVTIRSGALRGVQAGLEMPLLGVPRLWAFHDGLLVTIAGDLTRAQLIEVADSLERLQ